MDFTGKVGSVNACECSQTSRQWPLSLMTEESGCCRRGSCSGEEGV